MKRSVVVGSAAVVAAGALAAGCRNDFDPEGRPTGVLYEIVWNPVPIGLEHAAAAALIR
jgi:hypothetical protein